MAKKLKPECFDIKNISGEAVLFRTGDSSVNKFTFKIINLTGGPLQLTGGTPARLRKGTLPEGAEIASSFHFDFESMLSEGVVEHLKLTLPEGWDKRFFAGSAGVPPSWSVAPVNDVIIQPGDFVKIEIENIICTTTKPGNFEIMYRNIEGYNPTTFPVTKHLNVINPPDAAKKIPKFEWLIMNPVYPIRGQEVLLDDTVNNSDIFLDSKTATIYITYDSHAIIENGFTFALTNTDDKPLVPAESVPAEGADAPVFYISFLFGDEDYDVTTQLLADNNIQIDVGGKPSWGTHAHAGGTAYWQFSPTSPQVMAAHETVKFTLHKIITGLGVLADTISTMYVQFNNIPSHNDVAYAVQLQKKKAVAQMVSLKTDKDKIKIGENIKLSWVSALAKRVTIEYKDKDDNLVLLDSDGGHIKLNGTDFTPPVAPTAETTTIVAWAYDDVTRNDEHTPVHITQVQAHIQSFAATPRLIDNATTTSVTLSWEVENTDRITLTTPGGLKTFTNKIKSYTLSLDSTFLFTLSAYSYGQHLPVPDTKVISLLACKREKSIPLPVPLGKMQNLPAILVNNRYRRLYIVCNSINTIYDIDIATLAIVKKYAGSAIALSQDGSKLFTFNTNVIDRGVTMYDVVTGIQSEPLDITRSVPIDQSIVTPDLKKLFFTFTIRNGEATVSQLITLNVDAVNNTISHLRANWLGEEARGLAFNAHSSKIYVANYGKAPDYKKNSISIVNMADGARKTLELPAGTKPVSFACKKSANKLYVVCEGGNKLLIMDTTTDLVSGSIVLSSMPGKMLLGNNDKYLYVANPGANTVTVVDTEEDKVIKTIPVGNSPMAMAPDKDTHALFVANYCSKTLSVIDVDNHVEISPQLPTGDENGNPCDVALYRGDRGYTVAFVAKEAYTPRMTCSDPVENKNLEISVYTIDQQPASQEVFIE